MRQRLFQVPRYVVVFILLWSLLASASLTTISSSHSVASAAADCQNFPETGFQVCGKFLQYWQSHGGLTQQGFPIGNVFNEQNSAPPAGDGKVHKVQYFQRARFEEHTENSAPNDVLLGLLGTEQFSVKYNLPDQESSQAGCQYFSETGFNLCGEFLTYWNANGGLAQQGFPISRVGSEQNQPPPAGDGQVHQVQYFQRARFEQHNELGGKTLLGLLGAEQFKSKYPGSPPASVEPPVTQQAPAAGVQFVSVQGTSPGRNASVTVQTSAGAACDIDYYTPKGTYSTAAGLYPKNADGSGLVSWTWLIGGNTTRGTGTVRVSCGGASASTAITIG